MTTGDILFGNNSNILVVDGATVAPSIAASQLVMRVLALARTSTRL